MNTFIIGLSSGAILVAAAALVVHSQIPLYALVTPETIVPPPISAFVIGQLYEFPIENAINLHSDKHNLSSSTAYPLPTGFVIEGADWVIKNRKHEVNFSRDWSQPESVSVNQSTLMSAKAAQEKLAGSFVYAGAMFAADGALGKALKSLEHSFVLRADSHATVYVSGWADGRKYSSKDGVIVADLIVKARYVGTTDNVDQTLAWMATELARADAESIKEAATELVKSTEISPTQPVLKPTEKISKNVDKEAPVKS